MTRHPLEALRWWLGERLEWVPGVLRYDGLAPSGKHRYVNRISGYWIVR